MTAPEALGQVAEGEFDGRRRPAVQIDRPLELAFLAARLEVEADGTLGDVHWRPVEHDRGDRHRLPGPWGTRHDRDARHGDVPGERGPDRGAGPRRPRAGSRLAPVEPRALEVGQDMQLLGLLPRTDEEVAPRPSPRYVGAESVGSRAARRRSDGCPSAGRRGRTGRSPFAYPSRSDPGSTGPRQRPVDRPARSAEAHARRAVEQHDDQGPCRPRARSRPGTAGRRAGRSARRTPSASPAERCTELLPPRVLAEHDLEELERAQLDNVTRWRNIRWMMMGIARHPGRRASRPGRIP